MTGASPLGDLRVVEFAGLGPGPFAAMLLADAGADVLRVDRHRRAVDGGALVRGRPRLELDLKTASGLATARSLVRAADVVIEGFRPGVMEAARPGSPGVPRRQPAVGLRPYDGVGAGRTARPPARSRHQLPGADRRVEVDRPAGHAPVPPLNLVADYGGGGMMLAFGIVTALVERSTSGRGQVVDAAMVDGVSLLMTGVWSRAAQGRWPGAPGTNDLDSGAPFYDVYATCDGEYMAVGSVEPQFWQRLLQGLGLEGQLPEQWDRPSWPRMKKSIADAFATRSRAEWTAVFDRLDACVTPVLSMSEAALDPHLSERGTLVDVDGATSPAPAPRLSRTPFALREPDSAAAVLRRWRLRVRLGPPRGLSPAPRGGRRRARLTRRAPPRQSHPSGARLTGRPGGIRERRPGAHPGR